MYKHIFGRKMMQQKQQHQNPHTYADRKPSGIWHTIGTMISFSIPQRTSIYK